MIACLRVVMVFAVLSHKFKSFHRCSFLKQAPSLSLSASQLRSHLLAASPHCPVLLWSATSRPYALLIPGLSARFYLAAWKFPAVFKFSVAALGGKDPTVMRNDGCRRIIFIIFILLDYSHLTEEIGQKQPPPASGAPVHPDAVRPSR